MSKINTENSMEDVFEVQKLKPFDLQVVGTQKDRLDQISKQLIERLLKREKFVPFRVFAPIDQDTFLDFSKRHLEKNLLEWDFEPVTEMKETPYARNDQSLAFFGFESLPLRAGH